MNSITTALEKATFYVEKTATEIKEKSSGAFDFVKEKIGAIAEKEQPQAIVDVQPLPTAESPEDGSRGAYALLGRMSILIGHPDLIKPGEYETMCAEAKEWKFHEKAYFRGQLEKFGGTFKKLAIQEAALSTHAKLESPPDYTSDE